MKEMAMKKEPVYLFPTRKADIKVLEPKEEIVRIPSESEQLRSDVDFLLMLAGQ